MNMFVTAKTKDDNLHIRLKPVVKEELKIVADARGMTMSGLVYSMIVKTIREEKNEDPQIFKMGQIPILKEPAGDADEDEDDDKTE